MIVEPFTHGHINMSQHVTSNAPYCYAGRAHKASVCMIQRVGNKDPTASELGVPNLYHLRDCNISNRTHMEISI